MKKSKMLRGAQVLKGEYWSGSATILSSKFSSDEDLAWDTTECKTCLIKLYENPELWCKNGCVRTDSSHITTVRKGAL